MQSSRFAPADVAARYPYPVVAPACWRAVTAGSRVEIPLTELVANEIVVPSFAMLGEDYGFRFSLEAAGERWHLAPIAMDARDDAEPGAAVSTHIDYFHVHAPLAAAVLIAEVTTSAVHTRPYLLTVARRPFRLEPEAGSSTSMPLIVPPVSQLAAPRSIRHRICSTTCVNMVLSYFGVPTHNGELAPLTHHAPSRMYGVWPLNLWAASRKGALGAIELLRSLDDAAPALAAGLPVVASIRFREGELPGAPLRATGGHLVVVTGLTDDEVIVNDPAGRGIEGVYRRYPRKNFAAAWLTERGAAYVITAPR